MKADYMI